MELAQNQGGQLAARPPPPISFQTRNPSPSGRVWLKGEKGICLQGGMTRSSNQGDSSLQTVWAETMAWRWVKSVSEIGR